MLTRVAVNAVSRLALVLLALRDAIRIGRDGVVLIEAADDQHLIVRHRNRRGIPAARTSDPTVRRAACSADRGDRSPDRTAHRDLRRTALRRTGSFAQLLARARLRRVHPGLGLGVEDVHLVQAVVALHVVTAEDVDASIGQRDARVAVGVVEHPLRVAVFGERGAVHGEVVLVEQRRVELPAVGERVGMIDVEQQLPLHRAVGDDARRHALAQTLPHQVAAVGEPLKRIVRDAITSQSQERIEAVQHVAKRRVELESRR